jgi:hypothetical protein
MTGSRHPSQEDETRVIAALAVQPFVTGFLAFSTFPIIDYTGGALYGGRSADLLDAAISFAIGAAFAGFLITWLGAAPAFVWLRRRGPITRTKVFLSGAILGNVPAVLIVLSLAASRSSRGQIPDLDALMHGPAGAIRAIAFGSFIGVASAAVFWWVAGRHITVRSQMRAG